MKIRCPHCGEDLIETLVKEYSYIQESLSIRYEVLGWWSCECKKYDAIHVPGYTPDGVYVFGGYKNKEKER